MYTDINNENGINSVISFIWGFFTFQLQLEITKQDNCRHAKAMKSQMRSFICEQNMKTIL